MAGKSRQPSHEPHVEGQKTGTRHTDKTVERKGEGQGRGDSLQGVPTLSRNANARKTLTENTIQTLQCSVVQEHEESWRMHIYNKPLTVLVKLVLLQHSCNLC